MRIILTTAVFLMLGLQFTWSQSIENVRATVQNEFIIIQYDLRTAIPDQEFTISLFASSNNFSQALNQVSGDVGPNIKPGNGKSISWAAKSELGTGFKGQISFEVRGVPIITAQPYTLKSPIAGTKAKLGKTLSIEWAGGKPGDEVTLQLMQNGVQKGNIAKTSNTGSYNWVVPKSTSKGEYQLILLAGGSTVQSNAFQIKPKPSPLFYILPIALIGGGAVLLMGGDGEGPGTPANNDLPAAPDPD